MKKAFNELFIEGAIDCVARLGIENTRTKMIADYTGFSEATLFRAFGTKDGILESAFLYVDKRISDILIKSDLTKATSNEEFETKLRAVWHAVYRHLIDFEKETLFLIRYRYSSLYTMEVRSKRMAYTGGFDKANYIFEKFFGNIPASYRGFFISYIFEMTLCFAEKVITGRIEDNSLTERQAWNAVFAAVKSITVSPDFK